eukprot:snap_masked-scaffold774_size99688-processed-gene-0.3 protein:Tk10086 transcript:snap_masked-scaffold774_size99688-processed-gene-0.3-mRNA-1 annotation:"ib isoform4"
MKSIHDDSKSTNETEMPCDNQEESSNTLFSHSLRFMVFQNRTLFVIMSAVKDLPKLQDNIKDEILSPHKLKETHVNEKNVLPSAEDVKQEKTHQSLIQGVETFQSDKLHHVKTREPASGADVVKTDMAHQGIVKDVSAFAKDNLKHVKTDEKNPLPNKDGTLLWF